MNELWLPIVGTDGERYEISNVGRVYDKQNERLVSLFCSAVGYVLASVNGKPRKVHLLVAEAFICPRPDGLWCLHRDDDKLNNTPTNLYWGTLSQNVRDAIKNGKHKPPRGMSHPHRKLTEQQVLEIYQSGKTPTELAAEYQISRERIYSIRQGKTWVHVTKSATI